MLAFVDVKKIEEMAAYGNCCFIWKEYASQKKAPPQRTLAYKLGSKHEKLRKEELKYAMMFPNLCLYCLSNPIKIALLSSKSCTAITYRT